MFRKGLGKGSQIAQWTGERRNAWRQPKEQLKLGTDQHLKVDINGAG